MRLDIYVPEQNSLSWNNPLNTTSYPPLASRNAKPYKKICTFAALTQFLLHIPILHENVGGHFDFGCPSFIPRIFVGGE